LTVFASLHRDGELAPNPNLESPPSGFRFFFFSSGQFHLSDLSSGFAEPFYWLILGYPSLPTLCSFPTHAFFSWLSPCLNVAPAALRFG